MTMMSILAGNAFTAQSGVAAPGQNIYTTPGTYSWTAPAGVTTISVALVGGGGCGDDGNSGDGGGGGGAC